MSLRLFATERRTSSEGSSRSRVRSGSTARDRRRRRRAASPRAAAAASPPRPAAARGGSRPPPRREPAHRPLRVRRDERPHRELGAEALGHLRQHRHGAVEIAEPARRHVVGHRHHRPAAQAAARPRRACPTAPSRGAAPPACTAEARAKSAGRCASSARVICSRPRLQLQRLQPLARHGGEAGAVEARLCRRQPLAHRGDQRAAEAILERLGHRRRCRTARAGLASPTDRRQCARGRLNQARRPHDRAGYRGGCHVPSLLPLAALIVPSFGAAAAAAPWRLDPTSPIAVDVAWQGSTVEVRFPAFAGTVDFDPEHPERARATIGVAAGSATTGVGVVDGLVRSRDYLAAAELPADHLPPRPPGADLEVDRRHLRRHHPARRDPPARLQGAGAAATARPRTTPRASTPPSISPARSTAPSSARPAGCRRWARCCRCASTW